MQYCVYFCHTSLLYYSFNVCSIYSEFPALIYIGNVSMFLFFWLEVCQLYRFLNLFLFHWFFSLFVSLFLSLSWYSLCVSVSFYLSLSFFSLTRYRDTLFFYWFMLFSFFCLLWILFTLLSLMSYSESLVYWFCSFLLV